MIITLITKIIIDFNKIYLAYKNLFGKNHDVELPNLILIEVHINGTTSTYWVHKTEIANHYNNRLLNLF
jgi:hypothetical protein